MELIPWAPGTGPSFEETMELYRSSFPPNELREEASQRRIMKDTAYKYLLAREKTDWVGLLDRSPSNGRRKKSPVEE